MARRSIAEMLAEDIPAEAQTIPARTAPESTETTEGGPADTPAAGPADRPTGERTDAPTGTPADAPDDRPTGEPTGAPADEPTGPQADAPADGRARPRVRERTTKPAPREPQKAARARTAAPMAPRPQDAPPTPPEAAQPPRRELDVAGRSYRSGLDRLRATRGARLTAAVRAMLAAGATPAEVLGLLAETQLPERDLPPEVAALLEQHAAR